MTSSTGFVGRRVSLQRRDGMTVQGRIAQVDIESGTLILSQDHGGSTARYGRQDVADLHLLPEDSITLGGEGHADEAHPYQHLSGKTEWLQQNGQGGKRHGKANQAHAQVGNEWAKVDAADVLGQDFDFAKSLQDFDKAKIFDEIKAEEAKASHHEDLLVDLNRKAAPKQDDRMRKLAPDEMVLDRDVAQVGKTPKEGHSQLDTLIDMAARSNMDKTQLLECAGRNLASLLGALRPLATGDSIIFFISSDIHGTVGLNASRHLRNARRRIGLVFAEGAERYHGQALKALEHDFKIMSETEAVRAKASIVCICGKQDQYPGFQWTMTKNVETMLCVLTDSSWSLGSVNRIHYASLALHNSASSTVVLDLGLPKSLYDNMGLIFPHWNESGYSG